MPRLFYLIVFLIGFTAYAQPPEITDVNKDIDVAIVYERVVKEGYGTPSIYLKLANKYYFLSRYEEAVKWFETLFKEEPPTDKTVLFRYKQSLKALRIDYHNNPYLSTQ